ncbi:MAG: carboxypeptidase-like regulatory domain-containing protein [Saprospiraceae bacterium]|nr:carboxypeptidase-like regulatory domain-containing protein [Saprospiraceae bacterium]
MKIQYPVGAWCALFLLFATAPLFAQLTGTVLDEHGEPLPFASVYVRNSTNGTVANAEGVYRLVLEPGTYEIVFQYIGYQQKFETVTLANKPVKLNARLEPSDLQISEVVITTEDPAYGIMRKAIEKREYYRTRTDKFTCEAYIKGFYKLADAPKKIFGQDIGDMDGMLDSATRSGVLYLSESVSKLYVQSKPSRKKEVMISSKVSGSPNGYSLNRSTLTELSLYDERLNFGRDILSPLASNAFTYYRYRLIGRYRDENGYDIYKIEVTPKNDESPTYSGFVYIVDEWWNLSGADLYLTGKAIQQPILDSMHIVQNFVPVGKPDIWCMFSQNTGFKFKIFGFKIAGFFNGVFSNYDLNPSFGPEVFNREVFKIDKLAATRDSVYWSGVRPIPLTLEESKDYVKKDSIALIRSSKTYKDSMDHIANRFKFSNIYSGYSWRNTYRHTQISYPSLLSGVQFNTVQGWLINFDPEFKKSKDEFDSQYWQVRGTANYGFSEKRFRGGLQVERRFESIHYTTAGLSGGVTTQQFDAGEPISVLTNLLYSLWDKRNYMKLYEKAFVRGEYSRYLTNGLRWTISAEYAERRALTNHTDYSFYKGDRDYAPNAPLPIPATEPEEPFFSTHQAFLLETVFRLRFGVNYSTYPEYRSIGGSRWPEVTLKYRKGLSGLGGSDVDYDLIHLRVGQDELSLGLFGYTEWNLSGGIFWRNERMGFMDFYHPRGNQTFLGKPSRYASGFFLLPYYEFSTGGAFTEAHVRHHFNGFLLDRVPLLRKLNWKEALGASIYMTDQYAWEDQRPNNSLPYWELSFGFYNIGIKFLRPLHIDLAVGFLGKEHYRTGVVLGLNL